jgi:cytoskeletal protein CcmA (bactofilin family)
MKRKFFIITLLLFLIFAPLAAVKAASTKTGNAVYVSKDEIISGNLFAAGQTVTVDGTISGDLITAAQTINVNGQIEGDIIGVAQNIIINGNVGGNVRVAGGNLTINGAVTRNVNALGANIILGPDSRIGWDASLIGETAEIRGIIDGGLNGQVGQVLVAGKIGKDLNLTILNNNHGLTVTSEAVINGDLNYTAKTAANIDTQANIGGKVNQRQPVASNNQLAAWLWQKLFIIFSTLLVGLALILTRKNVVTKILTDLSAQPLKLFWPGLIILLILPPLAFVLLFTIIGLPLAVIIATIWLIAAYLAKIITAILAGQILLKNLIKTDDNFSLLWPLVLGVIVCWLLFAIPWVGWIIGLLAASLGLGGIWSYATHQS